jgi:acyl-homoserine lactone acylase PvdQ
MARARLVVAAVVTVVAAIPVSASARDFAGTALNIIPSGQYGSLPIPAAASRQANLYDGLTPLFGSVSTRDLFRYFKSERFSSTGRRERIPGRSGIRLVRDGFNVPHVTGRARADVTFAAGWVTAEDRGLLIQAARGPARVAALDAPGMDAFGLLKSVRGFTPSAQAERILRTQDAVLRSRGRVGRQIITDLNSYVAGINAYLRFSHSGSPRWTRNDVYAINALAGFIFGRGGGDEPRRAMLLDGLQKRLGAGPGLNVWNDLREIQDPEARVTSPGRFPWGSTSSRRGNVVIDDGSLQPVLSGGAQAAAASAANHEPPHASNFLIVGRSASSTGHPLFVAGPQIGYFYPGLTFELDLHGGGFDTRGAASALGPYVFIGRGSNYAWSLTSAGSDVIDQYAETLCGGDDLHYMYRGRCTAMGRVDAGLLAGSGGSPAREVVYNTTVHGPVTAYATAGGQRVAIAFKRASANRDILWQLPFMRMSTGQGTTARSFLKIMADSPFTFNVGYANDRDIATYSAGLLPRRAPGVDPGLPTNGTGAFEWRGYLTAGQHPQSVDPASNQLVNWNNKPALGFPAADDEYTYGASQRVQLLEQGIASHKRRGKIDLAGVVSAMNQAATQDLRVIRMLPIIQAVLGTGPAPNARDAQMVQLLQSWRNSGGSRLDRNNDGLIDDPGAAIIDVLYSRLANAALQPVLGPQLGQLNSLISRDSNPSNGFFSGWNSYLDKDLRTLLGRPVQGRYNARYCGAGVLATCRDALWAAVDAAGNALAASQGANPATWRASATAERITFAPGLLKTTIRYTNRPSGIQQVITFNGHP